MSTPDKFEKIYEADGVPITLFEIEEWWENTSWEQKQHLKNPDLGDDCRYVIARKIVREMAARNESEKLEILKTFRKAHQQQRESIGVDIFNRRIPKTRLGYDPDFRRIDNEDMSTMSWGGSSNYNTPIGRPQPYRELPRPPDLPSIVSNDPTSHHGSSSIFQQAMKMAQEKAQQEEIKRQQQEYARYQYEYIRHQQQEQYYKNTQKTVEEKKSWKEILGFSKEENVTKDMMTKSFRNLAMTAHPDHGGTADDMQNLIDARNQALKELD